MTALLSSLAAGTTTPGIFRWAGAPERDVAAELAEAGWEVLPLDTTGVTGRQDLYDRIAQGWGLPDWFGENLDALFDVLGEVTTVRSVLVWDDPDALARVDPDLAAAFQDVLRDAVELSGRFAVVLRGTGLNGYDGLT